MRVSELMTDPVVSAGRNDTLDAAYEAMLDGGFRHLPVTDGDGELVGVLSQRDIAARLGPFVRQDMVAQTERLERFTVGQAMSEVVDTIDPDDPVQLAAEILLERKISCLPVVEGTRLVGIVTESDFVRLALRMLEDG
ncbi:MAG: CBS domain-containing protein [Myxococcota bacterium]